MLSLAGSFDIKNKSPEAMQQYTHLSSVDWGSMGHYSHGKDIKSQLNISVELVIRFGIVTDVLEG
jgi:hypothetical protein